MCSVCSCQNWLEKKLINKNSSRCLPFDWYLSKIILFENWAVKMFTLHIFNWQLTITHEWKKIICDKAHSISNLSSILFDWHSFPFQCKWICSFETVILCQMLYNSFFTWQTNAVTTCVSLENGALSVNKTQFASMHCRLTLSCLPMCLYFCICVKIQIESFNLKFNRIFKQMKDRKKEQQNWNEFKIGIWNLWSFHNNNIRWIQQFGSNILPIERHTFFWCRQYKIGSYFMRNYDQLKLRSDFWALNAECCEQTAHQYI